MARHVEAWMDGVALSSLGPFLIQGVQEDAPELEQFLAASPGRDGQWLSAQRRRSLTVTLRVAIRELYDLPRRAYAAEQLAAWAQGHALQLSNRPERRLLVRCTGIPALGDVRNYTEELRVVWTAWAPPYWESQTPDRVNLTGASGTLTVPGTVETPVCLTVTPESALTSLSVTVGGKTITLAELAVPADTALVFDRDECDRLRITSGGVSLLSKRTAASADDLIAAPGRVAISYTANTTCAVNAEARGRWL